MYFDAQNLFSDQQAIRESAVSANLVKAPENVGAGEPVFVSAHVAENFAGLSSLNVQLQTSDEADGDFRTIQETGPLPPEVLNGGEILNLGGIPPQTGPYLRLNYVVDGAPTAGAVTAGITRDRQTRRV